MNSFILNIIQGQEKVDIQSPPSGSLTFTPFMYFDTLGGRYNEDTSWSTYVTDGAVVLDVLKPQYSATRSETLVRDSVGVKFSQSSTARPVMDFSGTGNQIYNLSSNVVLSGDFTVMLPIRPRSMATLRDILFHASNGYLRINNTGIQFNDGSTTTTVVFSNTTFTLYTWNQLAIKREGSTLSVSCDGGTTWDSLSCGTGDITLSTFFGGNSTIDAEIEKICIVDSAITDSQIQEFFNHRINSFTSTADSGVIDVSNLTLASLTNDIYDTSGVMHFRGTGNYKNGYRILSKGNRTVFLWHSLGDVTNLMDDYVQIFDNQTGQIYEPTMMPHYTTQIDPHLNGAIFLYNNRVYHSEVYEWYIVVQQDAWQTRVSDDNYDISNFTDMLPFDGERTGYGQKTGYNHFNIIGDDIYNFAQRWNQAGFSEGTCIFKTSNNFDWIDKIGDYVTDGGSGDWWQYPYLVYNCGQSIMYMIINVYHNSTSNPTANNQAFQYTCMLKTTDGKTFSNLTDTYSIDISITENKQDLFSELIPNFGVEDASADVDGSLRVVDARQSLDANVDLYGISGNGLAKPGAQPGVWLFFIVKSGVYTSREINTGAIQVVNSLYHEGGFMRKIGATSYIWYTLEYVSDFQWRIVSFRTSDEWVNTHDYTIIADFDISPFGFAEIKGTENFEEEGTCSIMAVAKQGNNNPGTHGNLWIKDITTVPPSLVDLDAVMTHGWVPALSGTMFQDASGLVAADSQADDVRLLKDRIGSEDIPYFSTPQVHPYKPSIQNLTFPYADIEEQGLSFHNIQDCRYLNSAISIVQPYYVIYALTLYETINNEAAMLDGVVHSFESGYTYLRVGQLGNSHDLSGNEGVPDVDSKVDFNQTVIYELIVDGANSQFYIDGVAVADNDFTIGAGNLSSIGLGSNGHGMNSTFKGLWIKDSIPSAGERTNNRSIINSSVDIGLPKNKPYPVGFKGHTFVNSGPPTKSFLNPYTFAPPTNSPGNTENTANRFTARFYHGNGGAVDLNVYRQMTPNPNKAGVATRIAFTIDTGTDEIIVADTSSLIEGDKLAMGLQNLTGSLSTDLSEQQAYYIVAITSSTRMQISDVSPYSSAMSLSDAGSGTQDLLVWADRDHLQRQRSDYAELIDNDIVVTVTADTGAGNSVINETANGRTNNSTRHHFYASGSLDSALDFEDAYFITNQGDGVTTDAYAISAISQFGSDITLNGDGTGTMYKNERSLVHVCEEIQLEDNEGTRSRKLSSRSQIDNIV